MQIDLKLLQKNFSEAYAEEKKLIENEKLPKHGNRWSHYQEKQYRIINSYKNSKNIIRDAQLKFDFDHRSRRKSILDRATKKLIRYFNLDPGSKIKEKLVDFVSKIPIPKFLSTYSELRMAIESDIRFLEHEFPNFYHEIKIASETSFSAKSSIVKLSDKRKVSDILFCHLRHILNIKSILPEARDICEIGAGYGDIARIWFTHPDFEINSYTIVDLPGSLFYSHVFLSSVVPDANIIYINSEEDFLKKKSNGINIFLIPLNNLNLSNRLPFDVILNTGSLGEMSTEWVNFYSKWIDNQNCKYFYSSNYFGNSLNNLYEGQNLLSPNLSKNWISVFSKIDAPLLVSQSSQDRHFADEMFMKKNSSSRHAAELDFIWKKKRIDLQIYHLIIRLIFEGGSISEPHKFIKKTMKDLGYPPKELLYFIRSVLDDDSGIFKDDILNEIKNLDKQLQKISDEGEEGIIH